ncbi:MAG: 16S rRNA (guanine(966)-N(2))-methyltransferase RsmD [Actinomycetota bacterium]|nr:16S rRNA (guanine(966)-N(2))-methyltransferase RsmD [Actinomycetota bacterium]
MKVISGKYKGRTISSINTPSTRPMMGIAREGIFNSLQLFIENSDVLDLFAGSGSMGIESLSRGAKFVTFIDNSLDCIKQINENLKDYDNDYSVINIDVSNYINQISNKYDIIFYDPPFEYSSENVNLDITKLSTNLNEGGFIVIHRHSNSSSTVLPKDVELYKEKNYGQSKILLFKKL